MSVLYVGHFIAIDRSHRVKRSREMVFVSHCVLNANARVEGLSCYAGVHPVVARLAERGYGVIQLPCPEVVFGGLDRPPLAIEDYDTPEFRTLCAGLAEEAAGTAEIYAHKGMRLVGCLGVEGSPSCGVEITNTKQGAEGTGSISVRTSGSGVFVQALRDRLEPLGVRFVGIDAREPDLGIGSAMAALEAIA